MAETSTKTCRICLQPVREDAPYHFLNNESDLMLQSKLLDFLPELDLNITQNPITCSQCTKTINEIHQFKQLCVRTENIIRNLSLKKLPLDDALHVFKKEQLDETIKEEFVENPIKNEQFSLKTVGDQCVLINTDIPACIEESTTTKASYYCYNCNYCTDEKKNLIKHVLSHQNEISTRTDTREKPFFCNICNYRCRYNSTLKTHLRTHTGEKPFQCNICDYRSNQMSNLKQHLRTHTKEKPFSCNICNYTCNEISNLNQHLHTHNGKKPFRCNICDYRFNQMSRLKTHLRTHTEEKPFCCKICNYRCNRMAHLEQHLRIHTKEKPFCCKICDYRCNSISNLKQHSRTHTGEKPFECNICDYRFNQISRLKTHLRTHTGEKPFSCNVCDYRSNQMSNLKQHLRTHSKENPS